MIGPELRLTTVLIGSLVVGFPALRSALAGAVEAEVALVRVLVIAVAAWIVLGALDRLVSGYASATAQPPVPAHAPEPEAAEGASDQR